MIEKLTTKCQMWEEKCDKLRQDLETANAKIRNSEMLGGGGKGDGPSGE